MHDYIIGTDRKTGPVLRFFERIPLPGPVDDILAGSRPAYIILFPSGIERERKSGKKTLKTVGRLANDPKLLHQDRCTIAALLAVLSHTLVLSSSS